MCYVFINCLTNFIILCRDSDIVLSIPTFVLGEWLRALIYIVPRSGPGHESRGLVLRTSLWRCTVHYLESIRRSTENCLAACFFKITITLNVISTLLSMANNVHRLVRWAIHCGNSSQGMLCNKGHNGGKTWANVSKANVHTIRYASFTAE